MKLPNGYGSITKLSGKRRRPYMVRLTAGWTNDAKQILKVLGYYHSRAEAMEALADYNKTPVDVETLDYTFTKVYELWSKDKYKDDPVPKDYATAYKRCAPLYDLIYKEIKTADYQQLIDECEAGYSGKRLIKILCTQVAKYAFRNDIINKNYAELVKLPPKEEIHSHIPFTEQEIAELWKDSERVNTQIVLIYIYTGLRPTELLRIERENVHLDERYMLGGMKTEAGRNRVIPIADKIFPFVERLYNLGYKFLLPNEQTPDKAMTYDYYRWNYWDTAMMRLHLPHKPHDCRHTCATLMDNAEINVKIKKLILGHASTDLTEKVYTHKTIEQLVEAINKI